MGNLDDEDYCQVGGSGMTVEEILTSYPEVAKAALEIVAQAYKDEQEARKNSDTASFAMRDLWMAASDAKWKYLDALKAIQSLYVKCPHLCLLAGCNKDCNEVAKIVECALI